MFIPIEEVDGEFEIFRYVPGGPDLEGFFESKADLLSALAEYQDEKDRDRTIAVRLDSETGKITARVWLDGSETPFGPDLLDEL